MSELSNVGKVFGVTCALGAALMCFGFGKGYTAQTVPDNAAGVGLVTVVTSPLLGILVGEAMDAGYGKYLAIGGVLCGVMGFAGTQSNNSLK
uniref:Uncharacterized protein n=1 Tax=viral metagenome TaxID=1070528 RepID=A0A6C0BMQ3_9ZZZZ